MTTDSTIESLPDIAGCEDEPIHIPDAIQPHGCVLVADPQSLEILRASENLGEILGISAQAALGQSLREALPESVRELMMPGVIPDQGMPPGRHSVSLNGEAGIPLRALVSLFRTGHSLVVEIEPVRDEGQDLFLALDRFLTGLRESYDSRQVLQSLVDEVACWSGYEHVMAYRFDPEWNGEVVAECRTGDLPSYLGHCFPASDIPAQARALYAINPVRHTPDVDYVPVPLVPEHNTQTGAPLDMTWSGVRSISPIHREYMRNMGVRSSLSLSLMVDGALWGMVLAHHPVAHYVPPFLRAYLQMAAQVSGDALQVTIERERRSEADRILGRIRDVLKDLDFEREGLLATLRQHDELLEAFDAQALVIRLHAEEVLLGRELPSGAMSLIEKNVADEARDGPVICDQISHRIPEFADQDRRHWLGGFLYARLSSGRDDAILFVREEKVRSEVWAGDPDNPHQVIEDQGLPRVHPRRSFASWQLDLRGCSQPWGEGHRLAAERLMSGLARHLAGEVERLLRHRAHHDALTQLPNRLLLHDRLNQAFRRGKRTEEHFVVLFLDLDGFKPVNDRYGHEVGDHILEQVAQMFDRVLRETDTAARVGGDEFVFLLEGFKDSESARSDGAACAQRLAEDMQAMRFEEPEIRVSCSIGIALYPDDGGDPDSLLRAADHAMYYIKNELGRSVSYAFASEL